MQKKKIDEYLSPTTGVLPFKMEQMICWSAQYYITPDDFLIEQDKTDELF